MHRSTRQTLGWWTSHVALPVLALIGVAALVARSSVDLESLRPFFDARQSRFPLKRAWFFEDVLHVGGRGLVAIVTGGLLLGAASLWRRPGWHAHARRGAYVAASLLLTVAIAGLWKDLARQVTPWDTAEFGGLKPWPSPEGLLGSPGAHAASGFAFVSLYFVGASLGARRLWIWLVPGLLLGFVFAIGQHVRGAHPPSHEPLSLALAWVCAATTASAFRKLKWLDWHEHTSPALRGPADEGWSERALPWLAGTSLALLGMAFYALDQVASELEDQYPETHHVVEIAELCVLVGGLGIGAWLLVDRIVSIRKRAALRLHEEQQRRLQVLGRMAASVAHEVRNPLQSMRLIIDEQRLDVPAVALHPLSAEFESCFSRIDRAVDLVYRLARPETGGSESADLVTTAKDSVASIRKLISKPVTFDWSGESRSAPVLAPVYDVRLVVDNLLRNAVEASQPGGVVGLVIEPQEGCWVLRIVNDGRLDTRSNDSSHGGLGLGIAISRHLVEGAEGALEYSQSGTQVTCTLRLLAAAEHTHAH